MKKSNLVKFSIAIREQTRELVDQKAFENNRSRSSMIDMLLCEAMKKGDKTKRVS